MRVFAFCPNEGLFAAAVPPPGADVKDIDAGKITIHFAEVKTDPAFRQLDQV